MDHFEDLKASIKACYHSLYTGKHFEALAAYYQKDAGELTAAGQCDHKQNQTFIMLTTFLMAGGAGNDDNY